MKALKRLVARIYARLGPAAPIAVAAVLAGLPLLGDVARLQAVPGFGDVFRIQGIGGLNNIRVFQ